MALVEAEVTEPGLADLRKDARCEIRPQSLIGEYFVDCQPGTSDERLPDGGRVPVEQTSSTIAIDLVGDIMRRPYRDRFRLIVGELGAGLAGRPGDLSDVLRRAHPALRETSQTLRILGRQTNTIKKFIGDANTVVGALENRKKDVSRFVREAGETAEISASRREELGESFSAPAGLPGRARALHGPPRGPDGGADAGPARPRVGLRRARHLPDPAAAVHRRGPAGVQGARRGVAWWAAGRC